MSHELTHILGSHRPSVLGQRAARIPTGGKIRAGIKVLSKAAYANQEARKVYEHGVAQGLSFEQIEGLIAKACPQLRRPLVPKNVPWFTVHPGDFANRGLAHELLERYGEEREDGVRRLYRFPVLFPADQWQVVMPHELVAWGASGRKFWSEYSDDGKSRHCMRYRAPPEHNGRRVVRIFGGRQKEMRAENGGACEPQQCDQFQTKQCNLSGRFIFYVPGIASLDAFELHTNSFYALSRAIEKFDTLAMLGNGRISGFLDHRGATFIISKQLREVSHINEQGLPERVEHWLIELEAPIDMSALLRTGSDTQLRSAAAQSAALLEGPVHQPEPEWTLPQVPLQQAAKAPHPTALRAATPSTVVPISTETSGLDTAMCELRALAQTAGHDPDQYLESLDICLGKGWRLNRRAYERVRAQLQGHYSNQGGA